VSRENVEIVRESSMAIGSGGEPAATVRFFDPSIEWDMSGVDGWLEKRVFRGQEEVMAFLQAWADSWQDWHFDLDEVCDANEEQVFAAIHEWGSGAGTGANVDQRRYFALTLSGGRMVRVRVFNERAEALIAVGLQE
jgi:ketosteroid isomerase-like protein